MSGSADAYLEARDIFAEAERRLRAMINRTAAIVRDCQQTTERVMFLGTGIGLPWPPGAAAHAIVVPDGDWPDARRLQQALAEWHEARAATLSAWEALPPRLKAAGLPQPPRPLRTDVLPGFRGL